MADTVRHICGISGRQGLQCAGRLSPRTRYPEMEYFFCDTGRRASRNLRIISPASRVILGQKIVRLNAHRGFDHWFEVFRGTLPSPQMRWCTKNMKIKPIEEWIGEAPALSLCCDSRR